MIYFLFNKLLQKYKNIHINDLIDTVTNSNLNILQTIYVNAKFYLNYQLVEIFINYDAQIDLNSLNVNIIVYIELYSIRKELLNCWFMLTNKFENTIQSECVLNKKSS